MPVFRLLTLFFFLLPALAVFGHDGVPSDQEMSVEFPPVIVKYVSVDVVLQFPADQVSINDTVSLIINGEITTLPLNNGKAIISRTFEQKENLTIQWKDAVFSKEVDPIPLWMSILPPLIAILFALLFREVFSALFSGLVVGSVIIAYYQGHSFFWAILMGLLSIADVYIIESLADPDHLAIIVFSMLIGATVTLISFNGGMKGVVTILSRYAKNPRSGQFVTWLLGIAIFFDDYANTLVVGNTMRPVADRLKISREKLSYIVDSTAAPITAIAFITTWIGAELSYIQDGINVIGLNESAYDIFVHSLAFSFYPVLALIFIILLIQSGRDFGPMFKAEVNARRNGINKIHPGINKDFDMGDELHARWYNAVVPVLTIVVVTVVGLITSGLLATGGWNSDMGFASNMSNVMGNANSYQALLWGSMSGVIISVLMTITQRILTLRESMDSLVKGFKTMLTAVLILVLAWSIALIAKYMHTADFISGILQQLQLSPYLLPSITFIMAALVAFATGSSWGTMAILYPLILPASWILAQDHGLSYDQSMTIFSNVVSTVLAGSVLGDHCSPISDTTILSSLASSCNHIEHVRTQLPYALVVGVVATLFGTLPAAYGVPSYILFPFAIVMLYVIIRIFGKKVDDHGLNDPVL